MTDPLGTFLMKAMSSDDASEDPSASIEAGTRYVSVVTGAGNGRVVVGGGGVGSGVGSGRDVGSGAAVGSGLGVGSAVGSGFCVVSSTETSSVAATGSPV